MSLVMHGAPIDALMPWAAFLGGHTDKHFKKGFRFASSSLTTGNDTQ